MESDPTRELFILRHAKSAWDTDAAGDFERPLAKRGRKDAPRMGRWLRREHLKPDLVISSPAARAAQTACAVVRELGLPEKQIRFDDRVYMADVDTLRVVIGGAPATVQRLLLIGHNPGLDELLEFLCPGELERTPAGKLLTTAALARVAVSGDWGTLAAGAGQLLSLTRPRARKK